LIKLSNNITNFLITFFLILVYSLFIIINKYYRLANENYLFLIIPISIFLLCAACYLLLLLSVPINLKIIKKFFLNEYKILLTICVLILLYSLSYSIVSQENTNNSATLKNFFNHEGLEDFFYKNYIIFFLLVFIVNIFLVKQLKIQEKQIFFILLSFSIFFLTISILQNIIHFSKINNLSRYITDMDNCTYFQFLPFAVDGKRNFEILPFLIGYILTLGIYKNKFILINTTFFIACFLTYSKNLWIAIIFINITSFFLYNKINILKFFIFKIIILLLTIISLNFIFETFDKKCNPNIKDYTIIKIFSLIGISQNEVVNSIKMDSLKKMSSFRLKIITNNEDEFLKRVDYLLDSTAPRIEIYKESVKKISKKILLGYGSNNFKLSSNNSSNSESEPLKILLDLGIIGLLVWIYLYFQLLKSCKTKWSLLLILSILSLSAFNIYSWFLPTYFIVTSIIFFENNERHKSIL